MNVDNIEIILATDCGSTTSKARFFRRINGEYRFSASGEAPTTVEAPYEDVTMGVRNAVREIEELTGLTLLDDKGVKTRVQGRDEGVDLYVTTSSAGGGLQMIVSGLVKAMTAESAERAALGAGAIVMDVYALDDGRETYEKIQRLRFLRPDMILIAGGADGGATDRVVETAELIAAAKPEPRLGIGFKLPVVYAGNKEVRPLIERTLDQRFVVRSVENIRPKLEVENVEPARSAIHEFFMQHVMSHAPGYDKLMIWTKVPILPTPAAEGMMFQTVAKSYGVNVIGVGLGGATTNVYSVYDRRFVRTVSANLGMSYSICNVMKETGIQNIMRWVPFKIDEVDVANVLRNKMIRPTTIPQTLRELLIEHAVAREAIRLGFVHHKFLARPLAGGIRAEKDIEDFFAKRSVEETYIDMLKVRWIGGTGGLLSHAPIRAQSALILIDSFQPEGVTMLGQDSVFMMPHLGVLSTVHPKAAMEIFEKDCLVRLGTCIAARGLSEEKKDGLIARAIFRMPSGEVLEKKLTFGEIERIPLGEGKKAEVEIAPRSGFDVGAGSGHTLKTMVEGGIVGVILDGRGRPLTLPDDKESRSRKLVEWFRAMEAYPKQIYEHN